MAVDKAIDSAKLNAALTYEAGRIRAKTGGSANINFDYANEKGFGDAIDAIPTGGGASWVNSVDMVNISFFNATISDNLTLDLPGVVVGIGTLLRNAKGLNDNTEITINAKEFVNANGTGGIQNIEQGCKKITKLTLNATGGNPKISSQFLINGSIQKCLGTPLLAGSLGGTGSYKYFSSTNLTEFYLVPNKAATGGQVITGVLVDDSLVSLANALIAGSETINIIDATTKAKCSTIVGTVSSVTDDSGTYDFFTQDASGTVTLADFITTVKGWTLA